MKTRYFILALSIVGILVSCNKASQNELPAPEEQITITVTLPDDATKAGVGERTTLSWTWSAGDKLTIVGETTEVFSIKPGFTPKKAEFVGTPVKGDKFTIYYPGLEEASEADWSAQVQNGNNDLDHLKYAAALVDVDDYLSFSFSEEWAAEHGGSISQTGVLKFILTPPAGTVNVSSVSLSTSDDLFFSGNGDAKVNALTLQLQNIALADGDILKAWMVTSWNEATIPAGTPFSVTIEADGKIFTQKLSKSEDGVLKSGMVNKITLSSPTAWKDDTPRYASGEGTEADPYVITTPQHLLYMAEDLLPGSTGYFKLGADINMDGMTWTPLNAASPYDKQIVFDGDGHTISNFSCIGNSYPSFFGVLYGEVRNVTFLNPYVSVSGESGTALGVVAGYFGTGDKKAKAVNVHVVEGTVMYTLSYRGIGGLFGKAGASAYDEPAISGCSYEGTVTSTGGNTGVGGLIGIAQNMVIEKSWVNGYLSNNANYIGGLVGYESAAIEIRDCWSAGSLSGNQRIGGIIGGIIKEDTIVRRCYSTMSLSASVCMGGIAGHASLDKWSAASSAPRDVVEDCIAWNSSIRTTQEQQDEYPGQGSSGAIVGYTSIKNTLKGCIRRPDLDFAERWTGNVPYDQEDSSPENPLVEAVSGQHNYPYHGKAAADGSTISSVAQSLGWSADVWDFSKAVPKLK